MTVILSDSMEICRIDTACVYKVKKKPRHKNFTRTMENKLAVFFAITLLAFAVLVARIVSINKNDGDAYKKQVYSQQGYESTVLHFKRGDIVDRKGSKLAYSEKVYNVIIDSKRLLSDDGRFYEPTLGAVTRFFPEIDMQQLRSYVKEHPTSQYKKFAKKLDYEKIAAYQEYADEVNANESDNDDIDGVWFEEDYKRRYPYGSMACDVIGFTQGENTGYFGLEEYYNDTLNGINGRRYGYLNEDSVVEQAIKAATDGNTIVTTIDVNIQDIVEKHILAFSEEHKNEARLGPGADNIGCIIMNPNNGEILAMASYPSYDLSNPKDLSRYYGEDEISEMDEKEQLEALNQIWRNFCIQDTYEPGSTAKPFTVAAALEAGCINGNESYNCTGALDVGDHTIHCHNRLGDGILSVQQGIQKSCNVVLMNVAFSMGKEKWLKYNRAFNFGLKTNVDIAGEVNASSLVFNENMVSTDLAVGSFGQGFNATMIQIVSGYCALINGGYYYQPHLVSKIKNAEGATVKDIEPRILKQVISGTTSARLRDMLRSVVMEGKEGTGYTARPAGYSMGGKTGTAEKLPRDKKNYLVSFCGYVPAENPEVLIYVVVDKPNVALQDNARYATVLTRDIMTEVLPYMGIMMTEELSDDERAELENMQDTFAIGSGSVSVNEAGELVSTEQTESGQEASENSDDNTAAPGGAEEDSVTVSVNKISYDAETGYPIDPNTGQVLDPETLLPIDGSSSFMD